MTLMEGKLEKRNGVGFVVQVQKMVLAIQQEWFDFVPTEVRVAPEDKGSTPESVEVLLANQERATLPVYADKLTRCNHIFVCRPVQE